MVESDRPSMIIWGDSSPIKETRHLDIIPILHELNLPPDFSVLEVACGYGTVVREIKLAFPTCNALGIDARRFPHWNRGAARYIKKPLQDFIKSPSKWDVVIMLNSYRNWEGSERVAFDTWLQGHADYFIASGVREGGRVIGSDGGNEMKLWQYLKG